LVGLVVSLPGVAGLVDVALPSGEGSGPLAASDGGAAKARIINTAKAAMQRKSLVFVGAYISIVIGVLTCD
jgi:hypothetical protein